MAPGWPAAAQQAHGQWWAARIARQKEIDASIAAKAEFEYLYDKPYEDRKKVRVAGPFTVESEWFRYKIDRRFITATTLPDPHFTGWYIQGGWMLTGESRVYNAVEARIDAPKLNYSFNPEAGTWGAFELVGRYSDLNLNYRAGAAGAAATRSTIGAGRSAPSAVRRATARRP